MALQVSLTSLQQNSCLEWVFTDSTGAYNVSTNPTGWGTPNWNVNDGTITEATLSIASYDKDARTFGTPASIDVIENWTDLTGDTGTPFGETTTLATLVYTVTSDMGVSLADGVHQVTYTVGNGSTTSTITYNIATYCNIECCIEQYLAEVHTEYECASCTNAYLEKTMILWTLLQALKLAACSASVDKYMTILTTLQSACEEAGCGCS